MGPRNHVLDRGSEFQIPQQEGALLKGICRGLLKRTYACECTCLAAKGNKTEIYTSIP